MRAFACVVLMCCLLATWNTTRVGSQNLTQTAPNVVTDWALVAQNTIAPTVFLGGQLAYGAMVPIAMRDAAVAIAGGYRSYTAPVTAPPAPMRPRRSRPRPSARPSRALPGPGRLLQSQRELHGEHPGRTGKERWDCSRRGGRLAAPDDACGDGLETCIGPCSSNPPCVQPPPGPACSSRSRPARPRSELASAPCVPGP